MLLTLPVRHAIADDACNLSDATLLLFRQAQTLFEFAEGYWRLPSPTHLRNFPEG